MQCLTYSMRSKESDSLNETTSKWKFGRCLNIEVKSDLSYSEGIFWNRFHLFSLSPFLLWFSFRSLDSWTLFSGLETSGLFSRRPAGIPRGRDIFQTQWRNTRAAITKAGTTKTAMGPEVGTASRRVWGHPPMSLANSPVALPPLPTRFKRVALAFFWR